MFIRKVLQVSLFFLFSCATYQATDFTYEKAVDTSTRAIEQQIKKTYSVDGIYADNQFDGARLNDFQKIDEHTYQATIKPENAPINMSPWYAFKLWAEEETAINLVLHYENGQHRYAPLTSKDGDHWVVLDSNFVSKIDSTDALLKLTIGTEPLWVAAQELTSSTDVKEWCEQKEKQPFVDLLSVGNSVHGREMLLLDMNEGDLKKKDIIVILSRQHPPEVTGYFAMQAFIDEILADTPLSNDFRKKYHLMVFPLMNPDGVDFGHWRHNAGGIDLNRDWALYRQPEVRQVADYIVRTAAENKSEVILGLDFHSTFYDIYYTNQGLAASIPNFKDYWISGIQNVIQDEAKVRPSFPQSPVSKNWFFNQFEAESVTYEIGDSTPRDFIVKKGQVSAIEMMQLLIFRE